MLSTLGSGPAARAAGASRTAATLAATARRRGRREDMGRWLREAKREWPYCTTAMDGLADGKGPADYHRPQRTTPQRGIPSMVDFPTTARRARHLFPASCLAAAFIAAA